MIPDSVEEDAMVVGPLIAVVEGVWIEYAFIHDIIIMPEH